MTNERYTYDESGDVLEVYFTEPRPVWTIELTDNIMISIDRSKKQVVSLTFLDFTELIRPTAMGLRSFPLKGLADLPFAEREMVVELLTAPPVNQWLDLSTVQALPDSPFVVTHLQTPPPQVLDLVAVAG
jgi:uncharacterized protein YuzE